MKKFCATIAIALTASLGGAQAATKLTLAYTASPPFLASFVAADQGFFTTNGLDVDLQLVTNGGVIAQVLVAGGAQIGGPTPTVLLQANDGGLDLVAVGAAEKFPVPYGLGILARPDSGIKTVKDLEGKKIGVPGINGVIDVMARKLITASAADDSKVNHVEVSFVQMPDMMKGGQVDAVAAADPFYGRVVAQHLGTPLANMATIVPDGTVAAVYAATRAWAEAHKSEVARFTKALKQADDFINDPANEARVRESLAKYTKLPPQIANTLVFSKNLDPSITAKDLQFWIDAANEQKMLTEKVDAQKLVFGP